MKKCTRCSLIKDLDEFWNSKLTKDGKQSWCRSCLALYNRTDPKAIRDHYLNSKKHRLKKAIVHNMLKEECVKYKGGKCCRCGYNRCNAALEFHHLDKDKKSFTIWKMIIKIPTPKFEELKLELDKCVLLCSNCHTEEHFRMLVKPAK